VRNLQQDYMVVPETTVNIDESHPNQSLGLFVQQELNLSQAWTVYLGARYDDTRIGSNSLSPRVAVTYKRPAGAVYKVLYGRSFRNPSAYERFYVPSPGLKPEAASTFEVAREQKVAGRMNLVTSVYYYRLRGLIEGVPVSTNALQYRNNSNTRAGGVELELSGLPRDWLELSASVSLQRTRNSSLDQAPANSPGVVAQFRSGVPLLRRRVYVQPAVRYLSSRRTMYDSWLSPVLLTDLTVTTNRLHPNFDVQFGIRNLANRQYSDPLSAEHLTQVMPAAGRSVYVKLIWQRP
jgi:outer membrane receptor protein involved in Fe transport